MSTNTVDCAGYTQEGIILDNDAPTDDRVSSNTVSGCTSWGILLNTGSDRTTISDNQVSQSKGNAIEIRRSTGVTLTNNVVDGTGSALKALVADTSPSMTVTGNRVSGFTVRGVLLYRSDRTTISNNQISQGKGYAVDIMNTTGVTMMNNLVDGARSTLKALVIDTSSNVSATSNGFSNFTQNGVLLYGASPAVLDLITIRRNTFSKTTVPYAAQLSGGATLGRVVFSSNTTA